MSPLRRRLLGFVPALALFGLGWLLVVFARSAAPGSAAALLLALEVRDDSGEPLAEVPAWLTSRVSSRALGKSDARGRLRASLARADEATAVHVRCPEAYRAASAQALPSARTPSLTFVCRPRLRTIAVVAHVPSARGLGLRADQQSLGHLDDQGLLHAVLRRAPGSIFTLTIEDPAHAQRQEVRVDDRDRIVLFDAP